MNLSNSSTGIVTSPPARISPIRVCARALGAAALPTLLFLSPTPSFAEEGEAATAAPAEEVVITEKAREHFRAGVNLLQDPDGARHEEAYGQFRAAYAESPSWKILGNLGVTAMKLEKDGEAIDAFEKYLKEGGADVVAEEREQYQRDLDTLRASVVTLTISATPAGVELIDERLTNRGGSVRNEYSIPEGGSITLRVRPGSHKITARMSGHESQVWKVKAGAGTQHEHGFELVEPSPDAPAASAGSASPTDPGVETHRPVPMGVWIAGGATAALAVGGGVMGVMALGANSDFDQANEERAADAEEKRNSVQTLNLVADVLIGGAVVAGVVTTVLYVIRPEVPVKTAVEIQPLAGPTFAGLAVSGNF